MTRKVNISSRERAGVATHATLRMSVDRPYDGWPPLHMAIYRANKTAIRLLLDNDADVETTDSFNRTPLIFATQTLTKMDALPIVSMLVQAGSNLNRRDDDGIDPLIGACRSRNHDLILYLVDLGVNVHTEDHIGSNSLHYLLHDSDEAKIASTVPYIFNKLTQMLVDPYQANKLGWTPIHFGMHRRSMTALMLNGNFQGFNLAPIPWSSSSKCPAFPEVACLTSAFRLYRRRLSFEKFRKLLNTEPTEAWSPLCRAAATENLEAMKNLLSMRSQIDFEGCPEGPALMVASRAGILDSVIFLVRHGASISFKGHKQHWSAVKASAGSTKILHWLLVDRFVDQYKLKGSPDNSNAPSEHFRKWSGIAKAEMIISGVWERRPSESSRQYWSALERMKQDFYGKVIPPDRGAKTRRQSKLVPSESVRIAAGGYSCTNEDGQGLYLSTEVEDFLFWSQLRTCFKN